MEDLYTCDQVAKRYGVKKITIWDWIRKKKLSAIKIGKSYRVSDSDLLAFESSRKTT